MIRVLLVDDHPVVRSGYLRLLDQAGDIAVIAEADDGDAGYAAFVAHAPDVTVTDLAMPGTDGLALMTEHVAASLAGPQGLKALPLPASANPAVAVYVSEAMLDLHGARPGGWRIVPLTSDKEIQFDFEISMGVRFGEKPWKDRLDEWIRSHGSDVQAILAAYKVPSLEVSKDAK